MNNTAQIINFIEANKKIDSDSPNWDHSCDVASNYNLKIRELAIPVVQQYLKETKKKPRKPKKVG